VADEKAMAEERGLEIARQYPSFTRHGFAHLSNSATQIQAVERGNLTRRDLGYYVEESIHHRQESERERETQLELNAKWSELAESSTEPSMDSRFVSGEARSPRRISLDNRLQSDVYDEHAKAHGSLAAGSVDDRLVVGHEGAPPVVIRRSTSEDVQEAVRRAAAEEERRNSMYPESETSSKPQRKSVFEIMEQTVGTVELTPQCSDGFKHVVQAKRGSVPPSRTSVTGTSSHPPRVSIRVPNDKEKPSPPRRVPSREGDASTSEELKETWLDWLSVSQFSERFRRAVTLIQGVGRGRIVRSEMAMGYYDHAEDEDDAEHSAFIDGLYDQEEEEAEAKLSHAEARRKSSIEHARAQDAYMEDLYDQAQSKLSPRARNSVWFNS